MKDSHPHSQHTLHLLLDMVSFEAALARPLTPAVRAGSMLLLLDCALNLPHVFGFKLARKEDLGDWVVVGLLAINRKQLHSNHFNKTKEKYFNKYFSLNTGIKSTKSWWGHLFDHLLLRFPITLSKDSPWLSTLSSSLGGEYLGLLGPRFGSRFLLRTSLNRLLHGRTMEEVSNYQWRTQLR